MSAIWIICGIILSAMFQSTSSEAKSVSRRMEYRQTIFILTSFHIENSARREMFESETLEYVKRKTNGLYRVIIKHNANAYDLWRSLRSPLAVGIIWASHSGMRSGAFPKEALVDFQGFEVQKLFQVIHPNLRFLGLLGCNSMAVQDAMTANGFITRRENLKIISFDRPVFFSLELGNVLVQGLEHLEATGVHRGISAKCELKVGLCLRLRRSFPSASARLEKMIPSVRVEIAGRILTVFPSVKRTPDAQERHACFEIPEDIQPWDLNVHVDAGDNLEKVRGDLELGRLELEVLSNNTSRGGQMMWRAFNRPDGSPRGITKHLYEFKGTTDGLRQWLRPYSPYSCRGIPSL